MNLFRSLGLAGWAWKSTLRSSMRPAIWLPFLLIAVCELAALGALLSFHRPGIMPLVVPLLHALAGERATHYPEFFFYLPNVYSRIVLVLSVLVASPLIGAATLFFARGFGVENEPRVWNRVARTVPTLIVLAAVPAAALYGVSALSNFVPLDLVRSSVFVRWSVRGGLLLAVVLIQSFMAYSTAWVVLEGHRILPALRDSIRVTVRTFLPTLIVVGVPILLLFPLNYLSRRVDLFATKLTPEGVAAVLVMSIALEIPLGFLLVGAITRLFVWRMEAAR
jgi:hypothetical protein